MTCSAQSLNKGIGCLLGTVEEKMEPWLGAITDSLDELHWEDDNCSSSAEYALG